VKQPGIPKRFLEGEEMLLHSITLKNLLSFRDASLEMEPLNVLIGPNACGKSNLIGAMSLLQAAPRDLMEPIRTGGGIREWAWKGIGPIGQDLHLECSLIAPFLGLPMPSGIDLPPPPSSGIKPTKGIYARYLVRLSGFGQDILVAEERLEDEKLEGHAGLYVYAQMKYGEGSLNVAIPDGKRVERNETGIHGSILAERRDPYQFPEITHYARRFERIKLYRTWNMGRGAEPRLPQAPDLANDFLNENADNLVHVLNRMDKDGSIDKVTAYLRRFYDRFDRLIPSIAGGTVQLFVREKGLSDAIPATWLSDGTLRLLYLLSILCNRNAPSLVCLEEPELGMHPDALHLIAEALVEASERMQLVVTTHSEVLIDALSDRPEAVVVCENDPEEGTRFRRLSKQELDEWLEHYTLGELWRKGEIGGKL
jgi:predicted ATPase